MKNNNVIMVSIISSLVTVIILAVVVGDIALTNQNKILSYLSNRYIESVKQNGSNPANDSVPVAFSQDTLVENVVDKANPAVISIVVTKNVPVIEQYYQNSSPFNDFFGPDINFQMPMYRQNGTEQKEVGGGTAFLISKDGLAITNKHVVSDDTASYTAFTNDGKKHKVTIVAKDPILDVAIIKVDGDNFQSLALGDSKNIKVGQSVIAIGNALGEYRNTVSVGVVSGLSRTVVAGDGTGHAEQLDRVIQTDAAINPGNSGGPLIDLYGNVIGMNTAIVSGSENIGFAIPSETIKSVSDSVQKFGKIIRPYLGIRYIQVTSDLKSTNKLSVDYGVLVARGQTQNDLAVVPGSPADKAGIMENDIILEIDGVKLDSNVSLSDIVRQKKVSDTVTLNVLHKGQTRDVRVKLESAPQ